MYSGMNILLKYDKLFPDEFAFNYITLPSLLSKLPTLGNFSRMEYPGIFEIFTPECIGIYFSHQ
jgi:hypothetical protein